jgi:hypothetical protein
MRVSVDPNVVFKSVCDMSYEQREELLKLLVLREPDLADGLLCSLGAKYQRYLEKVQADV